MPGYQPLGKFPPFRQSGGKISFSQIRGGIINAEEVILAGGTRGRIRSENYDPTNETGWGIFGDGSASFYGDVFFGENAIFQGDLYSVNWDGTVPPDLSAVDTGATKGFALDSSVGSAQFMGDLFLGGDVRLLGGGTFRSGFEYAPGQTQAVEITTGGIFFESGQPDETNPGLLLAESGGFFGPDTAVIWLNTPVINTVHQGGYLVLQNDPDDAKKRAILGVGSMTGGLFSVGLTDAVLSFGGTAHMFFIPPQSWSPTLKAATTDPSLGSDGSSAGQYMVIGGMCYGWAQFRFGTSGVSAGNGRYWMELPVEYHPNMRASDTSAEGAIVGSLMARDDSNTAASTAGTLRLQRGATNAPSDPPSVAFVPASGVTSFTHASPWVWANNDRISIQFAYPVDPDWTPN